MKLSATLMIGALVALGACAEMPMTPADTALAPTPAPSRGGVPQEVREIAAPGQDLGSVVLLETDNCYWYQHQGPVERTLLPLRSVRGNPICAPDPAPAPASVG